MPRLRIWCGLLLLSVSPLGFTAQEREPAPKPILAPDQPSAALLEFIGDWNEDERQLIGMEEKADKSARTQQPKEVPHAP